MSSTELVGQLVDGLDPGSMLLRYVVVAEILTADGEQNVWTETHDGATRWDIYGLLAEALENTRADHARARQAAEDDDTD